jgi:hypothetical protein
MTLGREGNRKVQNFPKFGLDNSTMQLCRRKA